MTRTSNSDHNPNDRNSSIKFLYSYGGRILLRRSDGALRYVGGFTRVLSVDRSISFADLMVKFVELCGTSMSLKCTLPKEDLDLLVSIKSDEELRSIVGEYDRQAPDMKIRAVLFPILSLKRILPLCSRLFTADSTPAKQKPSNIPCINHNQPLPYRKKYSCYQALPLYDYAAGRREDAVTQTAAVMETFRQQLHHARYSKYY